MRITDVVEKLNLKVLCGKPTLDNSITGVYVSDLLSDVIGNAKEGNLWITIQGHSNIVAVASLKDLAAILIANGNMPDEDTIEKSKQENILILVSEEKTFELAGKIYSLLNN